MNKKIIYIFVIVVFILIAVLFINKKDKKIYLDKKYYNEGNYIEVDENEINKNNDNYILFTYNNYCSFSVPCDSIFKEFMEKYKIDFLKIKFDKFKNTKYYESIKYGPSIIIIKNNEIIAYLDPESDEDKNKYENSSEFEKWIYNYIYFEPIKWFIGFILFLNILYNII